MRPLARFSPLLAAANKGVRVGDTLQAKWTNGIHYPATVTHTDGTNHTVKYHEDGIVHTVTDKEVKGLKHAPPPLAPKVKPVAADNDPNIGRTWHSQDGERKVTGKATVGGKERYLVTNPGMTSHDLIEPHELDATAEREERIRVANAASRERDAADKKVADAKHADDTNLDGFRDNWPPHLKAKTEKTLLGKGLTVNGRFHKNIRDAIRHLHNKGYRVKTNGLNERRLEGPEGSFYDERHFTKTGFDYAEHLAGKRH